MPERDFLGAGWKVPLQVNPRGGIARASGEQKIKESIITILGTAEGERVMRPAFGSKLHTLAFEPNNQITAELARHYTTEALTLWEPRIQVDRVSVTHNPAAERLDIDIRYTIRDTNSPQNLVYPFYVK